MKPPEVVPVMVRVQTASRLHFGLLSLAPEGGRWPDRVGAPVLPARRFGGQFLSLVGHGDAFWFVRSDNACEQYGGKLCFHANLRLRFNRARIKFDHPRKRHSDRRAFPRPLQSPGRFGISRSLSGSRRTSPHLAKGAIGSVSFLHEWFGS